MSSVLGDFLYPFHNKDRIKYGFLGDFYDSLVPRDWDKKTTDYFVRPDTAIYAAAFPGMLECIFHKTTKDLPLDQRNASHGLSALVFYLVRIADGMMETLMKEGRKSEIPKLLDHLKGIQTGEKSIDEIALEEHERKSIVTLSSRIRNYVAEDPNFPHYWDSLIAAAGKEGRATSIDGYVNERRKIGSASGDVFYFCISSIDRQYFTKDKADIHAAFRYFGSAGNLADAFWDWKQDIKDRVIEFRPKRSDRAKLVLRLVQDAYQGFKVLNASFIPLGLGMVAEYMAHEFVDMMRRKGYKRPHFDKAKMNDKLKRFEPQLTRIGPLHTFQ